jgi:hypothetical protein
MTNRELIEQLLNCNHLEAIDIIKARGLVETLQNDLKQRAKVEGVEMFTPNYHFIKVMYYGPTNVSGSRVGLFSERFRQRKTIDYNYELGSSYETAIAWLEQNGFSVVGKAEGKDCYYIITDTFKPLTKE